LESPLRALRACQRATEIIPAGERNVSGGRGIAPNVRRKDSVPKIPAAQRTLRSFLRAVEGMQRVLKTIQRELDGVRNTEAGCCFLRRAAHPKGSEEHRALRETFMSARSMSETDEVAQWIERCMPPEAKGGARRVC
jgi:hypothetical protein